MRADREHWRTMRDDLDSGRVSSPTSPTSVHDYGGLRTVLSVRAIPCGHSGDGGSPRYERRECSSVPLRTESVRARLHRTRLGQTGFTSPCPLWNRSAPLAIAREGAIHE